MTALSTDLSSGKPSPSRAKNHLPGEAGIWLFLFGDMTVFSIFFTMFIYYRSRAIDVFVASQQTLNVNLGALNTIILLTSSWCVALGVNAIRQERHRLAERLLSIAFVLGTGFCAVKIYEYSEKLRQGLTLTTNDFYMYYYVFTGIHFLHVLIGLIIMAFTISHCRKQRENIPNISLIEGSGCYWHMVDLLWIILFPLIYLLR